MKKPIGSQFSFSNLDGARDSISSEDRLQISFERQEAVEDGEEEEMKEEKEEEEEKEENKELLALAVGVGMEMTSFLLKDCVDVVR